MLNFTVPQVIDELVTLISTALSVDKAKLQAQLVQELEGGAESYDLTKSDWKYGCSNGVFATPSVFINGVQVYGYSLMGGHHAEGDLAAMSLADWQALLDPLVEAAEAAQPSLWQGRSASTPS